MSRTPWFLRFLSSKKRKQSISSSTTTSTSDQQHSSTSLPYGTSPSSNYVIMDGGRRYNNRDDIPALFPEDDEENDRRHRQHWTLKLAFDGNFDSPVEDSLVQGIKVLDCACGPASWTMEMAKEYPRSEFEGLDVTTSFPNAIKPENCHFTVHNMIDPFPFPANHFEYIHQRLLVLGLLASEWDSFIRRLTVILKPGGWIESTEVSFGELENAGPMGEIVAEAANALTRSKGLNVDIAKELGDRFDKAGLINIRTRAISVSVNQSDKLGQLAWENFRDIFLALKPFVRQTHPQLDEEFLAAFGEECKVYDTKTIWYRTCAQKPNIE
ncbi:S-adenosyl-L-methionine-dependent methyltransferase [Lichtheimia hyalospora FSU 10163]|nr:S-adenosyl-L-methionine-dependent methyltransferase [Lichtheimia hyalospora FSU 10163]